MKKLKEYIQARPHQLELFELLSAINNDYSNTIELYDFTPKYNWGKTKRINGKFLEALEREFEFGAKYYKVRITPANIKNSKGEEKYYYPGQREELVEDALRKLACEGQGVFLDDQAGVIFSLGQLRQELSNRGHGYKWNEIKEALLICYNTGLEIVSQDGTTIVASHIFETVVLHDKDPINAGSNKMRCFVRFNPLVTASIKNNSFRMINYFKAMSLKNVIARQLHKRMSHQYSQASISKPYHIMLSTMIRDFGLTFYTDLRNNLRDVIQALDELKTENVIMAYEATRTIDTKNRNKLIDVKFIITPTPEFVRDAIKANDRHKNIDTLLALKSNLLSSE